MPLLRDYLSAPRQAPAPASPPELLPIKMQVDTRSGDFTPILGDEPAVPGPYDIIVGFDQAGKHVLLGRGARVTARAMEKLMGKAPRLHGKAKLPEGVMV